MVVDEEDEAGEVGVLVLSFWGEGGEARVRAMRLLKFFLSPRLLPDVKCGR